PVQIQSWERRSTPSLGWYSLYQWQETSVIVPPDGWVQQVSPTGHPATVSGIAVANLQRRDATSVTFELFRNQSPNPICTVTKELRAYLARHAHEIFPLTDRTDPVYGTFPACSSFYFYLGDTFRVRISGSSILQYVTTFPRTLRGGFGP